MLLWVNHQTYRNWNGIFNAILLTCLYQESLFYSTEAGTIERGVEKVMGFCTDREYKLFFSEVELFERVLVIRGFIILKYYLDISKSEQGKGLDARREDPLKQWKMSSVDKEAQKNGKIIPKRGM